MKKFDEFKQDVITELANQISKEIDAKVVESILGMVELEQHLKETHGK